MSACELVSASNSFRPAARVSAPAGDTPHHLPQDGTRIALTVQPALLGAVVVVDELDEVLELLDVLVVLVVLGDEDVVVVVGTGCDVVVEPGEVMAGVV